MPSLILKKKEGRVASVKKKTEWLRNLSRYETTHKLEKRRCCGNFYVNSDLFSPKNCLNFTLPVRLFVTKYLLKHLTSCVNSLKDDSILIFGSNLALYASVLKKHCQFSISKFRRLCFGSQTVPKASKNLANIIAFEK